MKWSELIGSIFATLVVSCIAFVTSYLTRSFVDWQWLDMTWKQVRVELVFWTLLMIIIRIITKLGNWLKHGWN